MIPHAFHLKVTNAFADVAPDRDLSGNWCGISSTILAICLFLADAVGHGVSFVMVLVPDRLRLLQRSGHFPDIYPLEQKKKNSSLTGLWLGYCQYHILHLHRSVGAVFQS